MSMDTVIYGAGSTGRQVRQVLAQTGERVLGFLDRERSGPIDGLPCVHPESPEAGRWRQSGVGVVVGVWNPYAPLDEIEAALHSQSWSRVENFPRLHARLFHALGDRFWLGDPRLYDQPPVRSQIAQARELWGDDKSRHLFDLWMQSRQSLEVAPLNEAWRQESGSPYFARDVPGWMEEPQSFVDCGAYDGDTLRELKQQFPQASELRYYGFEPDPANFARLSQQVRALAPGQSSQGPDASDSSTSSTWSSSLWPCGVWHETTTLSFRADGLSSSALDEGGSCRVPVVALDDVLHGLPIQMLKMDIEGAEPNALLGARELITRWRPHLAICLYHNAEHAWSIPLLLDSWGLSYTFSLRAYCCNGFEWVLYAVAA